MIPIAESTVIDTQRRDLHDVAIDEPAAAACRCAAVHLPTGRSCRAAARHADDRDIRPAA